MRMVERVMCVSGAMNAHARIGAGAYRVGVWTAQGGGPTMFVGGSGDSRGIGDR